MGLVNSKFFSEDIQNCQYENCTTRMEDMKIIPPFLLDLPPEIIEKILSLLALSDRKNIRLTCKRLYKLCNSDPICRGEKIRWSEDLGNQLDIQSDLFSIGRSYYNLVIENNTLQESTIFPFFEKGGAKIRALAIRNCNFVPGLLETIIMKCEDLCSLHLGFMFTYMLENCNSSDLFTLEPFLITRPNVTYLNLNLFLKKPYDYFHRIFSFFPKVKQLRIEFHPGGEELEECLFILDDIMKAGSNLESLQLNIPLSQSIIEKNFFEALPNLKQLDVNFNYKTLHHVEDWYPCCSNLVLVILRRLRVFHPSEMIRLLTNTGLKNLIIESLTFIFDEESFKKLVNSQLDSIRMKGCSGPALDSQLEANQSVKVLYMYPTTEILFPKYFRGLVHLTLGSVTDSILQSIFQYQENLRSLTLYSCYSCSINGFCGSENNGFEYSIANLQKLVHLEIAEVLPEVIQSNDFKRAFSLSRLKYLRIECFRPEPEDRDYEAQRFVNISTDLYENLTELRALRLGDDAMPSRETLSSLFSSLKHLNYLRYDMGQYENPATYSATFLNLDCKYYTIDPKKYTYAYSVAHAYHDNELDRMVILNAGLNQKLYAPKISTFQIDWIRA